MRGGQYAADARLNILVPYWLEQNYLAVSRIAMPFSLCRHSGHPYKDCRSGKNFLVGGNLLVKSSARGNIHLRKNLRPQFFWSLETPLAGTQG